MPCTPSRSFHSVCKPKCVTTCCSRSSSFFCKSLDSCDLDQPIDSALAYYNFFRGLFQAGVPCYEILLGVMMSPIGPINPESPGYDTLPVEHCPVLVEFINVNDNCLYAYAIIQNRNLIEIQNLSAICPPENGDVMKILIDGILCLECTLVIP